MADIDWMRAPDASRRRRRRGARPSRRLLDSPRGVISPARWWPLLADVCTDPAFAAAAFYRDGPAACRLIHQTAGGTAEFGGATFVRSGPAAARFYRQRC